MAEPVIMPRQGQSVETCVITKWFKEKGDEVKEGDLLFSYETDKAAFDEEAKTSGMLLDVFYQEGDEVPVLETVAVIGKEGESAEEFRKDREEAPAVPETPEPTSEPEKIHEPAKTTGITETVSVPQGEIRISPRAKKLAEKNGTNYLSVKGTGPGGRILERDILNMLKNQPVITPLARQKMEKDHLVVPPEKAVPGKRVTSRDLAETGRDTVSAGDYRDKPLTRMRRLIADSMYRSLQNSAQLTHHISADARKLLALRKKVKPLAEAGSLPNITLNDMVSYALIRALVKHPEINGHFLEDTVRIFTHVHLAFAVDTERGLMVPVVKDADMLTLIGLATRMKHLAGESQGGSINPDLLNAENASFTLTNLGAFGIEFFTPVLNLPQMGILGVNTIRYQPGQLEDGSFGFIPRIGLSLTYDHRAIDGAPASRFLKTLVEEIEQFNPAVEGLPLNP
ncbi:MAG: 2-oxo acid dehydrogenase subunit E2 [Bacteroidales bacterium]|nr:2-oxo acid dehydrogenase subunit E2 [Bacteroidales bacterium]